jgi:hypothetical protein
VAILGPQGTNGIALNYSRKQLPYLTLRKHTLGEIEGYYTGIAPGVCLPYTRAVEREGKRLGTLKAGESRSFNLSYKFLDSPAAVEEVRSAVRELQKSEKTVLETGLASSSKTFLPNAK